jgi:hypothetical protein
LGFAQRGIVQLRQLRAAGSKGSSAARDPADCGRGAGGFVGGIRGAVRQVWAAVDPAGAIASRPAVTGLLYGSLGAPADGAARVQSAVPLVCRSVTGRRDLGRNRVHQKPRAPDRGGHRDQVHGRSAQPGTGEGAVVERSFLGRWDADRGVGQHEELPPQRRQRRAAGAGAQWRARLSWREAQQRDARLDHRPRCATVSQGKGPACWPIWGTF